MNRAAIVSLVVYLIEKTAVGFVGSQIFHDFIEKYLAGREMELIVLYIATIPVGWWLNHKYFLPFMAKKWKQWRLQV